ncbi:MAG TPA: YebC/PmpR family DNA-binding transcriptional regulator [Candidatus Eremiobacteraceae bacterium]|nr:YebC/PmpR family DNA-binding transcriptional regulator [Candidatus Eremiobacteraceae bacterium]
MSGHSKWHNIRLHKGKIDAQRAQVFTKISKEIIVAAKSGLPDPDANFKLKLAVSKAREANMPMENIRRAIARATGAGSGSATFEAIRYEGFGPSGVAVIVDAVTDNRNRTASEMRYLFSRNRGNLGESGSVAWQFEERGVLRFPASGISQDDLLEFADIVGVLDVSIEGDEIEILTEPGSLSAAREELDRRLLGPRRVTLTSASVEMLPKTTVALGAAEAPDVLRLLDALDEHEDVTRVSSNADIPDALMEELA